MEYHYYKAQQFRSSLLTNVGRPFELYFKQHNTEKIHLGNLSKSLFTSLYSFLLLSPLLYSKDYLSLLGMFLMCGDTEAMGGSHGQGF